MHNFLNGGGLNPSPSGYATAVITVIITVCGMYFCGIATATARFISPHCLVLIVGVNILSDVSVSAFTEIR